MGSTTSQRKSSPLVGRETATPPAATIHLLPWRLCSYLLIPFPGGHPLDRQKHLRLTGFCDKKGACGFSSLHFILAAHMSLTQEPRGRQRRTEVINLHL